MAMLDEREIELKKLAVQLTAACSTITMAIGTILPRLPHSNSCTIRFATRNGRRIAIAAE